MKIGFLQLDVTMGKMDKNIRQARELLAPLTFDLMVFPEHFATGAMFSSKAQALSRSEPVPGGRTSQAVIGMAKEKQGWIVAGILERDGEDLYNSALVAGPQGYVGKHRKVNLSLEDSKYCRPGTGYDVFPVGGIQVGVLICLDNQAYDAGKVLVEQGAKIICQPASHQGMDMLKHFQAVAARNSVHTVSCNRVGFDLNFGLDTPYIGASQIARPDGNVLHQAPERLETVYVMEVNI